MKHFILRFGKYVLLHFALVLYSFTGVLSKIAGEFPLISWQFILIYGGALSLLVIYAILWQQVLKRMPLSTAFASKAVVIIWGILWGFLIFQEKVHWNVLVGMVFIIAGITLAGGQEKDD